MQTYTFTFSTVMKIEINARNTEQAYAKLLKKMIALEKAGWTVPYYKEFEMH